MEEGHDEEGAVGGGEGVGGRYVGYCAGEIAVGEGHGFGAACRAACVEDEGDVVGLGLLEGGRLGGCELAFFFDIENDSALPWVPVAFCDCGFVFAGCADGRRVLGVGAARDEGEAGGKVINIEFELGFLVCWVQGSGDSGTYSQYGLYVSPEA